MTSPFILKSHHITNREYLVVIFPWNFQLRLTKSFQWRGHRTNMNSNLYSYSCLSRVTFKWFSMLFSDATYLWKHAGARRIYCSGMCERDGYTLNLRSHRWRTSSTSAGDVGKWNTYYSNTMIWQFQCVCSFITIKRKPSRNFPNQQWYHWFLLNPSNNWISSFLLTMNIVRECSVRIVSV